MADNEVQVADKNFHLDGDNPQEEETEEELKVVHKRLQDLIGNGPDGQLTTIGKQELSLLKQFVHAPENADAFIRIVQICDFLDEDERNRELDAFYESDRLGMTTAYNIAHALSNGSINRKGAHNTSIIGSLLDALSHQKFTSNTPKGKDRGSTNPRSPLG